MGGHKPQAIVGELRAWLLSRIKEKDFTLRGLVAELGERGLKVDYKTVWNFVHAEKLSFKKNRVRKRTGSPGRRAQACAMEKVSDPDRAWAPGLHRRDLDQDQYGAAQGMGGAGQEA
jgi:putative transposase